MRFKLDENFGSRTLGVFRHLGHDALDFADVTRFPPHLSAGIAVIRVSRNPSPDLLNAMIGGLLRALAVHPVEGRLWIVEPGRIRIHQSGDE